MNVSPVVVVAATTLALLAVTAAVPRFRRFSALARVAPVAVLVGIAGAAALQLLDIWTAAAYAAVVALAATGVGVLSVGEGRAAVRRVRSRLLFGIPWGTLLVVAAVAAFYLVVQFGATGRPLVVPFVSWSYFYPVGIVTSPFAHASLGHVTGNLIATVALAPLAEYAFSHYPTERGETSFGSWRTNPYVRALVVFPAVVFGVSLLTGVFSWGATIGFSGVVYAFAGFALVRFPLATVLAVSAREVLSLLWTAVNDPITYASASPSFSSPWWAGISVQGHLFGFLVGAVLAAALVVRRRNRPSAARIWFGSVVFAASMSLWAVWWYGAVDEYVLFRALGVLLVVALAALLTAVVRADTSTLFGDVSTRKVAFVVLLLPVVTMSMVAVPVNLTTVADADLPGDPVEVRGYEVTYAEDVTNERVAGVDVPYFSQATNVSASGVIVASPEREIWTEEVSAGSLGFYGDQSVTVGGVGWQESVGVHRRGWVPAGASPVYNVYVTPPDSATRHVYSSDNATADPVVAGRQVRVTASSGGFDLDVLRDERVVDSTAIPQQNETTNAGGLTFVRNGSRVLAEHENTTISIASRESYE
ncbi:MULTISPECIES: rhomboid family intramembrane serine protease [Halobacterium]|uniref:rhomboid family intramembrane serine protease n=1 Tax=Halobacterium TaxID=2239 RepID=UPI0009E66639|nr:MULTISPECIES: rhomboid family intramembrane serine protease [Halobacterium]MCG1002817.1 rhomboid family intramembrane serine protease [Halobacterium noricense]